MDKILLKALDNLSVALEKISEALQKKGDGKDQSATATALQSGDFSDTLAEINTSVKSIKVDTQQILKNQETIIQLQKQKSSDKKTEAVEDSGDDKKKGQIKKGVTAILLIAVAVLAIGLAFKLVGKIDFLSVVGLSIAIVLVAIAFERVAKLDLTPKKAAFASLAMVIMSVGVMISSFFLSKVSPISIKQFLTAAAIAGLFYFVGPTMATMINALENETTVEAEGMGKVKTKKLSFGKLIATAIFLPILMATMALGIMIASRILSGVKPMSMGQIVTSLLIAGMFMMVASGIKGLIHALTEETEVKAKGFGGKQKGLNMGKLLQVALILPLIMLSISVGIWLSSMILSKVQPIGFMQALSAIAIAAIFSVAAFGISKLIKVLGEIPLPMAIFAAIALPLILPAMALSITLSSYIFSKIKPIGFMQFLTAIAIAAVFVIVSFGMKQIVSSISTMKWGDVPKIPVFFTLVSLAIATSAWIFNKFKKEIDGLGFLTILKVLFLGVAIGLIALVVGFALRIMGTLKWGDVIKVPVFFALMAAAIAGAAWIFSKFQKNIDGLGFLTILKILILGVALGIVAAVIGIVMRIFKLIGLGVTDAVKGGLIIVIIAAVVAISSLILSKGSYKKYPSLKWSLGVAAALGVFGVAALLLGTQALNPFFYAGLGIIMLVAATIIATSHILAAGKYTKYPTLKWNLGVSAALASFGIAAILLGFNAINPFFYAGLGIIVLVAETILDVSKILAKGKYNLPGLATWTASVVLLYTLFTPLIILLGAVGAMGAVVEFFGGSNPFDEGRKMLKQIAWSIVDVSNILQKGNYKQGPTKEWATGISIALGAFAPVYKMLVDNAPGLFGGGGGVGPDDFAKAIKTVSHGIIAAAWYFSKNKAAFVNGPPEKWAKGVGLAIGAFAPVYKMLVDFPYSGGSKMKKAIILIAEGVVAAAGVFEKGKAKFEEGKYPSKKWGKGVGAALKAFAPVFDALSGRSWYESGDDVIDNMKYGIVTIAKALVLAAKEFIKVKPEAWKSHPTSEWARGVGKSVIGFMDLFDTIEERGYTTTSFALNSMILKVGIRAMADVARILWTNKKFFTVKLDPNFIKNISKNLLGFGALALALDKMLVSEKMVTSSNSGVFGIGASKSTKTVRERRDLSLVKDLTIQLISVAQILWKNKKFFEFSLDQNWVKNLSKNLLGYAKLLKQLDTGSGLKNVLMAGLTAINPIAGLASVLIESNSDDAVTKAAKKLVNVAKIIHSGRKAFETKIDPNYMKNVGKNILDFNQVIKKLAEAEKGTSFFGRIGQGIEGMLGTDPISQIVRKMVTLAKGYDALASSLMKLGFAMRTLNVKNMRDLGVMTRDLAEGKMPKKGGAPSQTQMQMPAPSKMASVGDRASDKKLNPNKYLTADQAKRNHLYYLSKQMDMMIAGLGAGKGDPNAPNPVVEKLDEILRLLKDAELDEKK
jgi:hypothetical protein